MIGFAIFMFIFGGVLIVFGFPIFLGHNNKFLLHRMYIENPSKEYLSYVGKVVMFTGLSPISSGVAAIIINEESLIPIIILMMTLIAFPIIGSVIFKRK